MTFSVWVWLSFHLCFEGFAIEVLTASWGIPSVHLHEVWLLHLSFLTAFAGWSLKPLKHDFYTIIFFSTIWQKRAQWFSVMKVNETCLFAYFNNSFKQYSWTSTMFGNTDSKLSKLFLFYQALSNNQLLQRLFFFFPMWQVLTSR